MVDKTFYRETILSEKMITQLIFLGASTAFFEVYEIIRKINKIKEKFKIVAILDDNKDLHGKKLKNIKIIGGLDLVQNFHDKKFVFGIGSMKTRLVRHEIMKRLKISENMFQTIIHPAANIDPSAIIGNGCIVHPGVTIGEGAIIGSNSLVLKDVEPWTINVGSPCKKMKMRPKVKSKDI